MTTTRTPNYTLHAAPLPAPGREAERRTVERLVAEVFPGKTLSHDDHGAPFIEGSPMHISVSHGAGQAVIAVSPGPVGVDIESDREQLRKVSGRFIRPEDNYPSLLHAWTAKEAVFKAAGNPALTLSSISLPEAGRAITPDGRKFTLTTHPQPDDSLITVAVPHPVPRAKALFHTLGCKLNFAETATIGRELAEKGIVAAEPGEAPDIIVVNTCSVTELADKKCRQTIRSFARKWPQAAIVVTGCYSQLKPEEAGRLPGVQILAGIDRKEKIAAFVERWLETHTPVVDLIPARDITGFTPMCASGDRTRWFLKVQDGCDYYCSYCTIPMARGRSRSSGVAAVVEQARKAASEGAREIVITGVNIGDFGKHRPEKFIDLIRALDRVEGILRYRISSIEPNLLTDEIIDFVASSDKFMPHFHLPLQSGDDEVLRLMGRHYDTALFADRVTRIRRMIPDCFIGVDLIVGARGETPERYLSSKSFVTGLPVSRLHVFPYSERPGTRALAITPRVDTGEKHRRAKEMIALSDAKLAGFAAQFAGTERPVLLEHTTENGFQEGFTDNYLRVRVPSAPSLANTVVTASLDSFDGENFTARIISQ